ncbi:cytochrome c [Chitinophagaceae bacterium LB-8]|uniref:Cytochrome c n=1 Tax=Paraflavisolibacter caeni TaxID=2982496 RepID=A0A9X3B8U0_9BACT|nr:cytochrome c [Paraflavisolibacter caeni]MCU7551240.1 cytochrome c [Paraflavisolibacter caeni]
MKKLLIVTSILIAGTAMIGCGGAEGNDPGRIYVPDMAFSRAYETYGYNNIGDYQHLKDKGINYTATPVAGTIARGDVAAYPYPGTDTGYVQAKAYRNPLDTVSLSKDQMTEAERIYLVNCAICHGPKLDGNGPLWKDGNGPYPAAPRNLMDAYTKALADGQIYHVIMYGKGQMGSYASQLKPMQRWMVVKYIRSKQGPATDTAAAKAAATPGTPSQAASTTTSK